MSTQSFKAGNWVKVFKKDPEYNLQHRLVGLSFEVLLSNGTPPHCTNLFLRGLFSEDIGNPDGGFNVKSDFLRLALPEEIPEEFRTQHTDNNYSIF